MTLDTVMQRAMETWFSTDWGAEAVTYTPTGGLPASINAVVERDYALQDPYVRGERVAVCKITCKRSDVENPQRGDTFEIARYTGDVLVTVDTWRMAEDGVVDADPWTVELVLMRDL